MYFIGNNTVLAGMVLGPRPYAFLITLALINIPVVLFAVFTFEVRNQMQILHSSSFTGNKVFGGRWPYACYGIYNWSQAIGS